MAGLPTAMMGHLGSNAPVGNNRGLAADARNLASLKAAASADPKGTVREVARQFEGLFMQELMKSMRAATPSAGLMDNEATKLGSEMLDQQLVDNLATRNTLAPGSLSEMIARQLERQMGLTTGPAPRTASANASAQPLDRLNTETRIPEKGAAAFVRQHTAAAQQAEGATGIPASFMISQAALETGWGRKEIRHADGSTSYNLFGIKAGGGWKGPVAEVMTTEYVNGKAQKVVQKFRAYGSYAESFADWARLMKDNPRYQNVVAQGQNAKGFAQGLQRAGYATDPAYASKLSAVINTTLRLQRAQA
jgi:flagellar protein FlgJ